MKHLDMRLLLLSTCIPHSYSLSSNRFSYQHLSTEKQATHAKRFKPPRVRGLALQGADLFGENEPDAAADEEEAGIFEARKRKGGKQKGKGARWKQSSAGGSSSSDGAIPSFEASSYDTIPDAGLFELFEPQASKMEPSLSKAPGDTQMPTSTTSPKATKGPKESPTLAPTQSPSAISPQPPTPPTTVPADPATTTCQTDDNGKFGVQRGDVTQVDFVYQMEIYPGITTGEAIFEIENRLSDLLIPELFPQCNPTRRLQNNGVSDVPSEYVGLDTAPTDYLAAGFECVGVFVEPCFVVRGWLTAYSQGKSSETVKDEITALVFEIFESGEIEQSIVDVDKVVALRDPMSFDDSAVSEQDDEITGDSIANRDSGLTLVSTLEAQVEPAPHSSKEEDDPTSSFVSSAPAPPPTNTTNVSESTPFILAFPWWGWLAIVLGIVSLYILKKAIDKLLEMKDQPAIIATGNNQ